MKNSRRSFFKTAALAASVPALFNRSFASTIFNIQSKKSKKLTLTFRPYTLELRHVFTVATMSRTTTPVVLTEVEYDGVKGYGEASMPPYLGESQESALAFLKRVDL